MVPVKTFGIYCDILYRIGNDLKFKELFDSKLQRFIIAGFATTIVGSAIMLFLYNMTNLSYWAASAFSYVLTSVLGFLLNKYYTFKVRKWSVFMILSYILVIAASYFFAFGISRPIINFLLINNPVKIRENIALFSGMCVFTGINYLGQRFLVFKNQDYK